MNKTIKRLLEKTLTVLKEHGEACGPNDDYIKIVHIIGPEGIDLNPWEGTKIKVIDLRSYEEINKPKTPEEKEDDRLSQLGKEVPTAFWLEPGFDSSVGNKSFSSSHQLPQRISQPANG